MGSMQLVEAVEHDEIALLLHVHRQHEAAPSDPSHDPAVSLPLAGAEQVKETPFDAHGGGGPASA
jgi:hypothetical protein